MTRKRSASDRCEFTALDAEPAGPILGLNVPTWFDDRDLLIILTNDVAEKIDRYGHRSLGSYVQPEDGNLVNEEPRTPINVQQANPDPSRPIHVDPLNGFAPQRPLRAEKATLT
jgi:hypothetical protein